jgi:hypothetical protein
VILLKKNFLILTSIVAAVAIATVSVFSLITYPLQDERQQVQTKNISLGELGNSIKPIYPNARVVQGKLPNSIDGVVLKQVVKNTFADSLVRDLEHGVSTGIEKQGLAEITLYMTADPSDGNNVVAVTLTNIGSDRFLLKQFAIGGETSRTGMAPLSASVLDSDYSPEVWGSIPKPVMTQLIIMNPSDSISAYIKGKYTEQFTGELIDVFVGSALYYYDLDTENYNNGSNWSISLSSVSR